MDTYEFIFNQLKGHEDTFYVAFSGGKDSMVILDLVLSLFEDFPIIHNPKDNTHPETVQFIYNMSKQYKITSVPSSQMENYIKAKGYTCQVDGTRISEFTRTKKSNDVVIDGISISRENMPDVIEKGLFGIKHIYPISKWLDEDVYTYIRKKNLPFSYEYIINGELS